MDARQELEELRRIDELERKAKGESPTNIALAGGTFAGLTATDIKEGTTLEEPVPKELGGTLDIEPLKPTVKPSVLKKAVEASLPSTQVVLKKAKSPEIKPDNPDPFMTGVATSVYKTGRGLAPILPQAVTKHLPSKEMLNEWENPEKPSLTRDLGQAAGDIAQTYATGGTNMLYNAALGGLYGGIQGEDDRLKGAAHGIVGSLGGQGVMHLLGHGATAAMSHIAPITNAAKKLIAEDIVPTIGQAVDTNTLRGKVLHGVEEIANRSRFLRPGVVAQTSQAEEALTEKALAKTGLHVPSPTMPLKERVYQMGQQVKNEYDAVFRGLAHPRDAALESDLRALTTKHALGGAQTKDFNKFIHDNYSDRFDQNKITTIPLRQLQSFRESIRKELETASGAYKDALMEANQMLTVKLRREVGVAGRNLDAVDTKYAALAPLDIAIRKTKGDRAPTAGQYQAAVEKNAAQLGKHPGDPTIPGSGLATRGAKVLQRAPADSESFLTDAALAAMGGGMIGPLGAVLPHLALLAGSGATKNPVTRAMMMGDKKARELFLQGLRKVNKVAHSFGVAGEMQQGEQ